MHSLIKISFLSLTLAGLTACGSGDGSNPQQTITSSSSNATASSSAPSSTTATSTAPSSTAIISSAQPSSNAASSIALSSTAVSAAVSSATETSSASESSIAQSSTQASATSSETSSSTSSNGNEHTIAGTTQENYSVAEIQNCGVNISAPSKTFAIFADYDAGVMNQNLSNLSMSGWNHTTNGNIADKWSGLKQTPATYNFATSAKLNNSCNDVDTVNILLVKKLADWDHQHANGFERNINAYGYKFGDIENLIIDIKVNNVKTSVPSVEMLKTTYANYVGSNIIEALDDGKVNIDLTLHDGSNQFGKINFQLDQTLLADKWVRVTIPMEKLYFYQEINYNRTNKTLNDFKSVVIQRALIVGEAKNGSVLRGPITNAGKWTTSVPETFKEMDISFKKIEFQLK